MITLTKSSDRGQRMIVLVDLVSTYPGFSISFGVDGLNIKVGGWRSKCHWHEPLGGSGGMPPQKNFRI